MTFLNKMLIVICFFQSQIAYGIWGISQLRSLSLGLVSSAVVVTRVPGVSSAVEFGNLVADPETRNTFLNHSVAPSAVLAGGVALGIHRYLGGISPEYTNSSVAKGVLFGAAALFTIRESLHLYEKSSLRRDISQLRKDVEQVNAGVQDVQQVLDDGVLPAIANGNGILVNQVVPNLHAVRGQVDYMAPRVDAAAAAAERLEGAVAGVAGQATTLQRGQGFLALGIFHLNNSMIRQGRVLNQHGTVLSGLEEQVGGIAVAQQEQSGQLAALGQGQARLESGQGAMASAMSRVDKNLDTLVSLTQQQSGGAAAAKESSANAAASFPWMVGTMGRALNQQGQQPPPYTPALGTTPGSDVD